MQVPDEHLRIIGFRMQVLMALLAKIHVLAVLQRVIQRYPVT